MAQHVKVDLKEVAPKLHNKIMQLERMNIFRDALKDLPDFKTISVLGLNLMKLTKEFTRYKYPLTVYKGSDYFNHEDWNDLKGIANVEIHLNKEFKLKDAFIVA